MLRFLFLILLFFPFARLFSQDGNSPDSMALEAIPEQASVILNGYVKNMQSLNFDQTFKNLNSGNLVHNRINFKWLPDESLTVVIEMRNRMLWGDEVRLIPDYQQQLRNPNELIDLSKIWFSNSSLILHTNTDRAYAEYTYKKMKLRAGRQRINWGISTIWNPNDLFNTYNFLDFDYEERPGSDAIKLTGELSGFSNIELAYYHGNKNTQKVFAGKYFINTRGYDIQLISGWFGNRATAGIGWAGNIGNSGFKGEAQFFTKNSKEKAQFNLSVESDFVFKNSWYLNGSALYNQNGIHQSITNPAQINFNFSPLTLMPTRWNFAATAGKEINPLLGANVALLYAPGPDLLLILPSVKYSLGENLSFDFIWQSFLINYNGFEALNHRGFLRIKLNY